MGYFLQPTTAPTARESDPAPVHNSSETAKTEVPEFFTVNSGRRFYSPELGRWLSRDPIEEEGGVNVYGFCGNASCIHVDRLGTAIYTYTAFMFFVQGKVIAPVPAHMWIEVGSLAFGLYPQGLQNDESQWDEPRYVKFRQRVTPEECITEEELAGIVMEAIRESNKKWTPIHSCYVWVAEVMGAAAEKQKELQERKKKECQCVP